MEKIYKNRKKLLLVAGVGLFAVASFCWLPIDVFSASEATRRLIHETLAKYGISSGGKEVCGKGKEPEYNKDTGIVKCKNDDGYYRQNCWDAESRSCKPCPNGFVVNKNNHNYCHQIICPRGFRLVKVQNNQSCPSGFTAKQITAYNPCPSYTSAYNEVAATSYYTSSAYNCKNINK